MSQQEIHEEDYDSADFEDDEIAPRYEPCQCEYCRCAFTTPPEYGPVCEDCRRGVHCG